MSPKLNEVVPQCLNPDGGRWFKRPYIVYVNGKRFGIIYLTNPLTGAHRE